jgi:hypothetical protein
MQTIFLLKEDRDKLIERKKKEIYREKDERNLLRERRKKFMKRRQKEIY